MKITTTLSLGFLLSASYFPGVVAQTVNGTLGSPSATTTIKGDQIPTPPPKFGGVIKETLEGSKPWWPPNVVPPKGAPNVLLIMTDDQGYGVSGTFGGVIPTPALDRIAKAGLRYTEFCSTALCSPTRAAAGCMQARLYADIDKRKTLFLVEEWESREQFERNLDTAKLNTIVAAIELSSEAPVVRLDQVEREEGVNTLALHRSAKGAVRH